MMNGNPPVLLLAGFGAFPGAPVNPSERLMERLRASGVPLRRFPATVILPVEWERSWQHLEAEIRRVRPDAVLVFGLHAAAERLRIEMTAVNERHPDKPDAAGRLAPANAIRPGPGALHASLPLDAVRHRLGEAGIDHEISDDAGRYLCNETLFLLCRSAAALGLRRYGFVHTPSTEECAAAMRPAGSDPASIRTIPADRLMLAARILISCLEDDLSSAAPASA